MSQVAPIQLELDLGQAKREALRYAKHNSEVTLGDFLRVYPARTREALPEGHLDQPLKHFLITPVRLKPGQGIELSPGDPEDDRPVGELRDRLDELYEEDVAYTAEPETYPETISDNEAVQIAYRHELQAIARFLRNDLSVLILCDKMLTEHIYEYVCKRGGKTPVLDDALPEERDGSARDGLDRAAQGGGGIEANLPLLIRNLKAKQVLVLRSVDILDTPSLIEVLYQGASGGKKPQLLGFLDPSLEVNKVLSDRFVIHASIMGLPRYIQPDPKKPPVHTVTCLITAKERKRFQELDPEGLYKNVSGLNAIQFRNAMRYVGATVAPGSDSRHIYQVIRQFKTSSTDEIEIPDTTFDHIGGYEGVKRELQRIVALVAGRVEGIDEREREKLIPRGFVFHGPPGTGKTLFAKAIANEMNATIQMISGPEVMDKYVGQSESNLRQIFATARRNAPSVIFFDEFDSIASQRSNYSDGGARANNAVVAQLLTELDGFRPGQAVLLIGTTNRLDIVDEALLRPSRLRPIEIGLPDYGARREVARIHARSFGVDTLLTDLCELALAHLPAWEKKGGIPDAFLKALFAQHPNHKIRYQAEAQREGFTRGLQAFFELVQQAQAGDGRSAGEENPLVLQMEERLLQMARDYGLDLTRPDAADQAAAWLQPMQSDIRELFELLEQQGLKEKGFTRETFLSSIIDLVAEYTDGFNNDEIRAIFQEASLEHHLEGQLVTPRYLGTKIGLIKNRRDEREVSHLSRERGLR